MQFVLFLFKIQCLPEIEQIIQSVGIVVASERVGGIQSVVLERKDIHRFFPYVDVEPVCFLVLASGGKIVDEGTDV